MDRQKTKARIADDVQSKVKAGKVNDCYPNRKVPGTHPARTDRTIKANASECSSTLKVQSEHFPFLHRPGSLFCAVLRTRHGAINN